jgi:23S rRNA pseudouridine1911/1915/1917 synthase
MSNLIKQDSNWDYTNPEIHRNIEKYGVWVDGVETKNRLEWIFPGQTVDFDWPKRATSDFSKLKIIWENEHLLALFKPKGVVVQPGAGHQKNNLTTWLIENIPGQSKFDLNQYPGAGLVHRLDKDTQGLLLIAKTEADLKFLQNQFRERKVEKKYLAVVKGLVKKSFAITNWQARDQKRPTRFKFFWLESEALSYDPRAKQSQSVMKPLVICPELNLSLIEIQIFTGRMHQIRLQCEALGFPLQNDQVYNQSKLNPPTDAHLRINLVEPVAFSLDQFKSICYQIFEDLDYSLLSNYIKFQNVDSMALQLQFFDTSLIK